MDATIQQPGKGRVQLAAGQRNMIHVFRMQQAEHQMRGVRRIRWPIILCPLCIHCSGQKVSHFQRMVDDRIDTHSFDRDGNDKM